MKVQQFLEHHGIQENPFGQEDAQTDHVFMKYCLEGTHHPAWDKIYGQPQNPSTAIVFGEKGSGKTALRLQIVESIRKFNQEHPEEKVFTIEYDDFNPLLDSFQEHHTGRKRDPDRLLSFWRLWDHMDAILMIGTRELVKAILEGDARRTTNSTIGKDKLKQLSRRQQRDLLLLSACYDHQSDQPPRERFQGLRKKLGYRNYKTHKHLAIGIGWTLFCGLLLWKWESFRDSLTWWSFLVVLLGWVPWLLRNWDLLSYSRHIVNQIGVFEQHETTLRYMLSQIPANELENQPLPCKDRSDDRYAMLSKFQSILETLGYSSIIVLVDRVDEPHLINGKAERMKELLWPMFDNKFLKHPGMSFKMLLPSEVVMYLNREDKDFYDRARMDKQNMIPSLEWTGESLYDVASDRIRACSDPKLAHDQKPFLKDLFEEQISEQELLGIFSRLRVPRHMFKFLYRLLVEHCNRYTVESPNWKIKRETLQSVLAVFTRDLEAFDRGLGTG